MSILHVADHHHEFGKIHTADHDRAPRGWTVTNNPNSLQSEIPGFNPWPELIC